MAEKVTFVASFPPIQSAIKVSGDGNGMRIMIDIPETEIAQALMLALYRQVPFRVTIEPYEQEKAPAGTTANGTAGSRTVKRSSAKKRI